jgi:hypothetical protein
MEPNTTSSNRRILLAIGFVLFFVIIVLVWYFFYFKPATTSDTTKPRDPLTPKTLPVRFNFLNWGNEPDTSTSTTEVIDPLKDPLVQIWNKPATGGTFITDQILKEIKETVGEGTTTVEVKKTIRATSTIVLFVDKTTGYIYGYPIETGKVFQISNSIIPGVYDAYFFDNGKRVIMRYVDQTKNTVVGLIANVPLINEGSDASPLENIKYLTSQVQSLAVNESKTEVSYVVVTETGSAIYSVAGIKNPTLITSSPFREWDIAYGGDTLYVTTKPSAYIEGTTFSLPRFEGEIAEKTGLMSLPSSSGTFLASMWGSKGLATFLSQNGNTRVLSVATLVSKCAQGTQSMFVCAVPRDIPRTTEGLPDDWFQGRISFNDDLYLIDSTTGEKYSLYSFTEKDGLFDVIHITVSNKGEFVTFTKKQDTTLWLLNTNLIEGE